MIYEDELGNIYTQEDIAKKAFKENLDFNLENDVIITNYINKTFKSSKPILINEVLPGDNIIVEGLDSDNNLIKIKKSLSTIQEYYEFKETYNGLIWRDYTAARNLKPTLITYNNTNIFDSTPLKLMYALKYSPNGKYNKHLKKIVDYLSEIKSNLSIEQFLML
jgi:hypothetical protein